MVPGLEAAAKGDGVFPFRGDFLVGPAPSTRCRLVSWLTIDNRKRRLDARPTCRLHMDTNGSGFFSGLSVDCKTFEGESFHDAMQGNAKHSEQIVHFRVPRSD